MPTIKIDTNKITEEQIDLIVDYLKRGQVIAYPTDTVYGLGCDARNVLAINKINKIKGQRGSKPLLILISDYEMLRRHCFVNLEQMEYLKKVWGDPNSTPLTPACAGRPLVRGTEQRPVTVILKRRPILPAVLTGGLNSLAVRLPNNEFLIKMIKQAGFPVVSTSLNKKGEKPLTNVQAIAGHFKYQPDLAIDAGECARTKPSRLVDLREVKNIKVLRE